ncbi:MAG: hypothetical protein FWD28_09490 [Treponema sp.]|nr:hypothetical protein [Treponema sp.]
MKKSYIKTELTSHDISQEDLNRINDVLLYEKWRDDGRADHKKRDIEKKIRKHNARVKIIKNKETQNESKKK